MKVYKVILTIFFVSAFLLIYTNLCILYGALKERKNKMCIGVSELSTYEDTLHIAEQICIGVQNYKNEELNECNKEIAEWKNNYNWLRKQTATSTIQN